MHYLSENFLCRVIRAQKISKLLFPVFNLSMYPSSEESQSSNFKEWRIRIKSWQREGSRGTKADGICDLTYKTINFFTLIQRFYNIYRM